MSIAEGGFGPLQLNEPHALFKRPPGVQELKVSSLVEELLTE